MYRENKYGEKVDVNKYECGSCKYYTYLKERMRRTNALIMESIMTVMIVATIGKNQMKQVVEVVSLQQPVVSIKGFLITVMNWRHYANLEMKCYRRMKKADSW